MPDALADLGAWELSAAFVGAGVILGLVLQRLIVARLRSAAERTAWKGDDVIIESLGRLHARYADEAIRIPFPTRTVEIVGGGVVAER